MVDQTGFTQEEKDICDSMRSCMGCPFVVEDGWIKCEVQERLRSEEEP